MTNRLLAALWLTLFPAAVAPLLVGAALPAPAPGTLTLPRKEGSVRFVVMGDTGRGNREQYEVAQQMVAYHNEFRFDFVIMLGDNLIGAAGPADRRAKFELPYKPLLDAGVLFHAALGNHDNPNQRFYAPFNMGGERFYTFRASKGGISKLTEGGVRFFALDTNYLDKPQLDWFEKQLAASSSDWKIAFFHHPLYSSARAHGSALETRAVLEPLFVKYGVNAAFSGHDHVYERIKPQQGIAYWVSGGGGSLRKGDVRDSALTAHSFDSDYHFMIVEISGDDLYFQTISRKGATVDSGVFHRPGAPVTAASPAPAPEPVLVAIPPVMPAGRTTPEGQGPTPPSPAPPQ